MKMLTVGLLLTAMLVGTRATPLPDTSMFPPTEFMTTEDYHFHGDWHPTCPDGWTDYHSRCLIYVPTKKTWADAAEHCEKIGGALATVFDDWSDDDICHVMHSSGHKQGKVWIGGHHAPENPWSWFSYFFHSHGDFYHGHNQHDCDQRTFGDEDPDDELPSVCSIILM